MPKQCVFENTEKHKNCVLSKNTKKHQNCTFFENAQKTQNKAFSVCQSGPLLIPYWWEIALFRAFCLHKTIIYTVSDNAQKMHWYR